MQQAPCYIESFNGKLEIFYTLAEARVLLEWWRREYNHLRPHSALRYRLPVPEAIEPLPLRARSIAPGDMTALT